MQKTPQRDSSFSRHISIGEEIMDGDCSEDDEEEEEDDIIARSLVE